MVKKTKPKNSVHLAIHASTEYRVYLAEIRSARSWETCCSELIMLPLLHTNTKHCSPLMDYKPPTTFVMEMRREDFRTPAG